MAGVLQHLRSSTLNKRPNPASMVDGQIAINYASGSPGAFFKDTNGNLVKVGPVHVGATAPNVSPASGGTAGNSLGEQWLDTSGGTYVFKIWDGAAWRSEAGEFVNSTGDTMTGSLTMGPSANLIFEGSTDDGFETTLTVVDPTADRTITLPNVSGTVVTTGDTGTITSTMIADGTIVDGDINASAAIAGTKISPAFGSQNVTTTGTSTAASFIPTSSTVPTNGVYLPAANSVAISTNGTGRLFVDASGFVGIGTATPETRLHVGNTVNNVFFDRNESVVGGPNAVFRKSRGIPASPTIVNAGDFLGALQFTGFDGSIYQQSAIVRGEADGAPSLGSVPGRLIFLTQSGGVTSERLRIDSSGRVGIGTTSPGAALDVQTSSSVIANLSSSNAAGGYITIGKTGSVSILGSFNAGSGGGSSINADALYFRSSYGIGFNSTGGGDVVNACLDTSGRFLVGTSTATTNGGVLQVSNGVTFPAAQSACSDPNTLDDYEEGSWTPTWIVATGSITANGNTSGRYTKIGRTVFIWGYISYESNSGASGDVSVGGLPFTAGSAFGQANNRSGGVYTIGNAFFASNSPNFANIPAGGTTMLPFISTATGCTQLTFANFSLGGNFDQFVFAGQYNV